MFDGRNRNYQQNNRPKFSGLAKLAGTQQEISPQDRLFGPQLDERSKGDRWLS
jgi:hypothetical protein